MIYFKTSLVLYAYIIDYDNVFSNKGNYFACVGCSRKERRLKRKTVFNSRIL